MRLLFHHIINIITKKRKYVNAMLEYFIQKDLQTILVLLHKHNKKAILKVRKAFINVGWEMGFEPTIFGTTIRRFNQLSYTHHICVPQRDIWRALLDSNQWLTA